MHYRSKGQFIAKNLCAVLLCLPSSLLAWEWVSVPGSTCRDGSPAGYFIENSDESNELLIFLEEGGACFNDQTCGLNPSKVNPNKLPLLREYFRLTRLIRWLLGIKSTFPIAQAMLWQAIIGMYM